MATSQLDEFRLDYGCVVLGLKPKAKTEFTSQLFVCFESSVFVSFFFFIPPATPSPPCVLVPCILPRPLPRTERWNVLRQSRSAQAKPCGFDRFASALRGAVRSARQKRCDKKRSINTNQSRVSLSWLAGCW